MYGGWSCVLCCTTLYISYTYLSCQNITPACPSHLFIDEMGRGSVEGEGIKWKQSVNNCNLPKKALTEENEGE